MALNMPQGFSQSQNDYSLFIKKDNGLICITTVYVDDIILNRLGQIWLALKLLKVIFILPSASRI